MEYDGDTTVGDFFAGDDGQTVLSSNRQTSTRASLDSLATITSGAILKMHLSIVCDYIKDHKSLSNAMILSASTYSKRTSLVVKHRFLVLHLWREGKKEVYLRLDRLRSEELSLGGFVINGARVPANDIAHVADKDEPLIQGSKWENTQTYALPPRLGAFRNFLLEIVAELVDYKAWPQNCWMFCSALQEHLGEIGGGSFTFGRLENASLSTDVRLRIRDRVMKQYPILFYAFATKDNLTPTRPTEASYRESDVFGIIGILDNYRWLGLHRNPAFRQEGRFFVHSADMVRVGHRSKDSGIDLLSNGKPILYYACMMQEGVDLHEGDIIAVTQTRESGLILEIALLDDKIRGSAMIISPGRYQDRDFMCIRVSCRWELPDVEFVDDFHVKPFYIRVIDRQFSWPASLVLSLGDLVKVTLCGVHGITPVYFGHNDSDFGMVRVSDASRIPSRQERPDLQFLDDHTPIAFWAHGIQHTSLMTPETTFAVIFDLSRTNTVFGIEISAILNGSTSFSPNPLSLHNLTRISEDFMTIYPVYGGISIPILFYVQATFAYVSEDLSTLNFRAGEILVVFGVESVHLLDQFDSAYRMLAGAHMLESRRERGRFRIDERHVKTISREEAERIFDPSTEP